MPFQHSTTPFYIKIQCAVTSGSASLVEGNVCNCVLGEELLLARIEVRGALLLQFFLFVGERERKRRKMKEKVELRLYQKVVSHRHQSLHVRLVL
jgi:hypothetical protein